MNTELGPIAVKKNPWRSSDVFYNVSSLQKPEKDYNRIKAILYHDMISEYDARLFSSYIYSLDVPFSPEFSHVEALWSKDEDNHFQGFKMVNQAVFGLTDQDLKEVYTRKANFDPISHLLTDEFSILLVSAYDELATVRGYSADIPIYDEFDQQFSNFIRRVIADEGWHYSKFLHLIKRYHPHRLNEVNSAVKKIRESEGIPYEATFVMDHVEDVFTSDVLDQSAEILRKHLIK